MKMFKYFFLFGLLSYLLILLFMFLFQRTFMYHPNIKNLDPVSKTFNYEEVFIPSDKNIELRSWFSFKPENKKTILFFHGNAGELSARVYKLNKFSDINVNFLIIS